MGNPMLIGMAVGAGAGALTNKDPLKGALMGGAMGAAGGSFAGGFGGLGGGAPALGTTSAASGFAGGNLAAAQNALNPTFMQRLSAGSSGLMGDIGSINKFMNANPTTSQIGMGLARDLMAPEQQMQMAPQGQISRGPVGQMDYMSLLNPQNQTVIRPQQISLLG